MTRPRVFILALLSVSAAAAKSSALMQVAEKMEEILAEVERGAGADPIAVNLLRYASMTASGNDTVNETESMMEVTVILEEFLRDLMNMSADDIRDINDSVAWFHRCKIQGVAQDDTFYGAMNTSNHTHSSCRRAEHALNKSECIKMRTWMAAYHTFSCPDNLPSESAAHTRDFKQVWTELLALGSSWLSSNKTTYTGHRDACEDQVVAWKTKTAECDNDQTSFESNFCTWRSWRNNRCDQLDSCWSSAENLLNHTLERIMGPAATRVNTAKVIELTKCLTTNFVNGTTNITACDYVNDLDFSHYGVPGQSPPNKPACDKAIVAVYPGYGNRENTSWWYQQYHTLNAPALDHINIATYKHACR